MKTNNDTLLILAAAGLGLWFITRTASASVNQRTAASLNTSRIANPLTNLVQSIPNNDVPGQPGFGWQYFSDGTAIGPDGSYYSQGQKVWSAT